MRFFTEALTFIFQIFFVECVIDLTLFVTECYTAFGEVVGRHLYLDFVAGENLDVMHAHLSGYMGGDFMPVLQLDAEHRI